MPNIKQQKRRVESAARQRLENVRYRSTAKTIFKRLEQAVQDGDGDRAAQEHRALVKLLDRAAARRGSRQRPTPRASGAPRVSSTCAREIRAFSNGRRSPWPRGLPRRGLERRARGQPEKRAGLR